MRKANTPRRGAQHRRRATLPAALLAALMLLPSAAPAGEAVIAAGADDISGDAVPALSAEFRFAPFWSPLAFGRSFDFGFGLAATLDTDRDLWAGAGFVLTFPIAGAWRAELSVMPGGYALGDGEDLGTDFPMIRSQIGASREIAPGWRVGAALAHKSNASTDAINPGVETFLVTLTRRL